MTKRVISLLIATLLLTLSLAGCSSAGAAWSFGPKEDISNYSAEDLQSFQDRLNKMDAPESGVCFTGYYTEYDEDGTLRVYGFLRNYTGKIIYDIRGTVEIKKNDDVIASAYFTFEEEDFGQLGHKESRPWCLEYTAEYVEDGEADLSTYVVATDLEFTQKSMSFVEWIGSLFR
ncbi:MAG: SLAP domain-containing protein [Ruminococcaceae bacterium]|nr:SLAP domain-containing protein [Oscillospiraceae bacterium]